MPTVYAGGKTRLIEPVEYGFVDSWAPPLNSNFGVTDAALSGTTTINVATISSTTPFVTLVFDTFATTPTPWLQPNAGQNLRILLTGALSFSISVIIPANIPGMWIFDNKTSGAFTVTVKTSAAIGGTTVNPPQNYQTLVFCDGTNVSFADLGTLIANTSASIYPGTIMPFGGLTAPPGYLICDGAAVSRTTYAPLFAAIGTLWGTGDGSTTFNVPNFQGAFLRGAGAGLNPTTRAVGSYEADDNKAHTHPLTDPGHKHTVNNVYTSDGADSNPYFTPTSWGTLNVPTTVEKTGITIADAGGADAHPKNFAVNYIIRT